MDLYIGKCAVRGCKHTVRKSLDEIYADKDAWNGFRCAAHPRYPLNFHKLNGVFNAAVKCDARCQNARGHNCECSCGGHNHGANYA